MSTSTIETISTLIDKFFSTGLPDALLIICMLGILMVIAHWENRVMSERGLMAYERGRGAEWKWRKSKR